ncbi:hypothetical protein AAVH_14871 [Aphelenchoides avenae]|nr:hypothetical protein AAVH_14871 [Aphelenchus avenae]
MCRTNKQSYECSTCGEAFTTLGRLKLHTYKHTQEKSYKCEKCDKACTSQGRLLITYALFTSICLMARIRKHLTLLLNELIELEAEEARFHSGVVDEGRILSRTQNEVEDWHITEL